MSDDGKDKPTASVPIFVGTGPAVQFAAELYLLIVDWMLRENEGVSLLGSLPGEISGWMSEMFVKEVHFERHNISERDKAAVQQEGMRESFAIMVDPNKNEETQLLNLFGKIPSDAMQQIVESLQKGDTPSANEARSGIVESLRQEFAKSITPESVAALGAVVARCRAAWAASLCVVLYKTHPTSLIADARGGDPRAVLKLVKIDKLFLTDSCTAQVIRQAELKIDRDFLKRLAKALTYKPKMGWRQGCKLYMYMILSSPLPLPTLPILQIRVDPDGSRFKTFEAFEKFVERCRKELKGLKQTAAGNPAPHE